MDAWNFDPTYQDVASANMYGCTPCPKCGEKYRAVFGSVVRSVDCDDCGFKEPVRPKPTPGGGR